MDQSPRFLSNRIKFTGESLADHCLHWAFIDFLFADFNDFQPRNFPMAYWLFIAAWFFGRISLEEFL